MSSKLSVVINTKNAATTLERTLESVSFADELIIVDMQSTDGTTSIAQQWADHVISVADVGYVEPARNVGLQAAHGDWILLIDADEVVPPKLKNHILEIIHKPQSSDTPVGYFLPRKNMMFGHWVQQAGWWPDFVLRLFKKGTVTWGDAIHSVPIVAGPTQELLVEPELAVIHWNYTTVHEFIERMNRYTSIQAHELSEKLRSRLNSAHSTTQDPNTAILKKFKGEFLSRLFDRDGIEGGPIGVGLSLMQSLSEVVVALKYLESEKKLKTSGDTQAALMVLREFEYELGYWLYRAEKRHAQSWIKKLLLRLKFQLGRLLR